MRALRDLYILVCGLLVIAACSPKEPKSEGSGKDNTDSLAKKAIIGTWKNCSSDFGETKVTVEKCRTIEFKDDNKGVITHGDLTRENIAWNVSGGELRIDLVDSRTDSMFFAFTDTLYITTLTKDSIHPLFDLKAKNKDIVYHLSK